MTYSIVARDDRTGLMGVACQSQALAVGSSVPWVLPGHGVIATQSMGEPMYGDLGLDALRGGLTASEALTALRSVDPFPERRQVAMVDGAGRFDAYTGEACVAEAGHRFGDGCVALANMVASPAVWEAMTEAWERTAGSMPERLMAALHAAEAEGGDFRGRRSAAISVARASRTGRPWRDWLVNLRVDEDDDPVGKLDRLVKRSDRYHKAVEAFDLALAGETDSALELLDGLPEPDPAVDPDVSLWASIVLSLAGRESEAQRLLAGLATSAPQFLEVARRFSDVGLIPDGRPFEALVARLAEDR